MVRRVLLADPDSRWCPAPDCSYAVIASGCASCPRLRCERPGCDLQFCYHCKAEWHPDQTCDAARAARHSPTRQTSGSSSQDSQHRKFLEFESQSQLKFDTFFRRRHQTMSALSSADSQDRWWLVQSHGVCRVWLRVLLAVQEGNHWPSLLESFGLHILGHKTVVAEEETAMAVGNACWCTSHDCTCCRNCCASDDHRFVERKAFILNFSEDFPIPGIPVWVGRKLHTRYKDASKHKRNCAVMGGVAASVSSFNLSCSKR